MELSILIVNYNVTRLLEKCLQSIEQFVTEVKYEVIVVDNNSPDCGWKDLVPQFPHVQFIASERNLGFARANNLAAKSATGKFLLLLNPDTEFQSHFMREILDFSSGQTDFGCLGVRLHNQGGDFHPESKRSVPNLSNAFVKLFSPFSSRKYTRGYYRNDIPESAIEKVEVITGAFLLTEAETFAAVGGLDARYFMYGEDIDFCYTLLCSKKVNWYYGKASILHHKGESTVKDGQYYRNFYGAMKIFVEKYYKHKPFLSFLLKFGLMTRYFYAKNFSK